MQQAQMTTVHKNLPTRQTVLPDRKLDLSKVFTEQMDWMTVRVTTPVDDKVLLRFMCEIGACAYVVGHELSKKKRKHSHMIIGMNEDMSDHKWKKAIKSFFQVEGAGFSKSRVRTTCYKALQYCLKDGDFVSEGFDPEFLKRVVSQSTKKFDKIEFKECLEENETKYYQEFLSFRSFARKFHDIRLSYGQKPNRNSMKSYLEFHLFKKDKEKSLEFIDGIVESITLSPNQIFQAQQSKRDYSNNHNPDYDY